MTKSKMKKAIKKLQKENAQLEEMQKDLKSFFDDATTEVKKLKKELLLERECSGHLNETIGDRWLMLQKEK